MEKNRYYVGYSIPRHQANHPRPIVIRNTPSIYSPIQAKTDYLIIRDVTFWVDYKSVEASKKFKENPIFAYAVGEVISHGALEKNSRWKLPTNLITIMPSTPDGEKYKLCFHPLKCSDFYIEISGAIKILESAQQVRLEPSGPQGHIDAWVYGPSFRSN